MQKAHTLLFSCSQSVLAAGEKTTAPKALGAAKARDKRKGEL